MTTRRPRLRPPSPAIRLGLAALALAAIALASCSERHPPAAKYVGPLPPQGLYEECPPADGARCLARLDTMASAGFTLVLNYNQLNGTADQELAYARHADALGMKVIWSLSNPVFRNGTNLLAYFNPLAETCACSDNDGFIRYVVGLVKDLPATWGYYVGDEVPIAEHAPMKAFADLIGKLDPTHPRLFVAGGDSSYLATLLAPFADTADVLGVDYYPVGTSESIEAMDDLAAATEAVADRNGKKAVLVLQAFSLAQYRVPSTPPACSPPPGCARFPSREEMRQMRDRALRGAHPQMLLWYSFYDIFRSDEPTTHWADLVAAAGVRPKVAP